MELTRRDAMAALAAAGVAVGAGAVATRWESVNDTVDDALGGDDSAWDPEALETTVAVAHAVYPSELENVESFVRTYALSRSEDDDAYREGMGRAATALNEYALTWTDERFVDLDRERAEELLHEMGVDVEAPDPEGSAAERVRFYLVNELLYALYTTDTGGKLVGIENPQGYPGGTDSYQRGPPDSAPGTDAARSEQSSSKSGLDGGDGE
jgi:hypothetical protein